jgi:hypothetical protein
LKTCGIEKEGGNEKEGRGGEGRGGEHFVHAKVDARVRNNS